MPVPLLGQNKEEDETKVVEAEIAFLVFRTKEGQHGISPDINVPMTTERTANMAEIKAAMHDVLDSVNNDQTAQLAAQYMMQMQMQIARQVQEAELNRQMAQGLKLS